MASIKYLTPMDGSEEEPSFHGKIRVTPDEQVSVFDVINAVGVSHPRVVWLRIGKEHPAVVKTCNLWKFPGRGQNDTPVADLEHLKRIVTILPTTTHECAEKLKTACDLNELLQICCKPGSKKRNRCGEKDIQAQLAEELKGEREVKTRSGLIDILCHDPKVVIEVKEFSQAFQGVGQVLGYAMDYPGYAKRLHVFRTSKTPNVTVERLLALKELCDLYKVELTLDEDIELQHPNICNVAMNSDEE
eukprot:jgi/Mesvir1/7619/Mv16705-RA.1